MAYVLGIKPDSLKINLWRDADFDSVLTRRAEAVGDQLGAPVDWGTSDVRLVFPGILAQPSNPDSGWVTWTCDVTGPDAVFQIDKAVTNERSNRDLVELWVGDQCWAAGKITKKGTLG